MKKILYVTTISSTIDAFLVPHIEMLLEQGYKVDCAANIDMEFSEKLLEKGVRLFQINFSRNPLSTKNKKAYAEIQKLQQEENYDIVHVHTPVASFITRLALRQEDIKVVYTCHGFHFYKGGPILNWMLFYPLEKIAANWTDCLITINTEDYKIAKKFKLRDNGKLTKIHGVGIEKEQYVIDDFDKIMYKKNLGFSEDDFIILVLAEINKNKNHIQLIKAMNLLKDKYPNIKAIFAGNGPQEAEIKNKIKENDLEDKIYLLGWRDDIKELINSSDVIGLFSKREGLGKCLLEAMICGKCVIATNTRGPREIIEHNINGFMVDVGDIESTAKFIEELYINNDIRCKFDQRAIDTADKYLLDNVLNQLSCIYEELYKEEIKMVGKII